MAANGDSKEDYQKLLEYGIDPKVAEELDNIYKAGILAHSDLDERALDALKEFPAEGGVEVLKEFKDSNLEHVSNKSAYLCGVMKTCRQKNKGTGGAGDQLKKPGPDETKIKEILARTGYDLDVTVGQRKYGGPPPGMDPVPPSPGHEIFCGKVPKDVFEDELIPLFEECGTVWDLRLMMDPISGYNRGYCFVTFMEREGAQNAVQKLDDFEVKPGKKLKVNLSVANLRLFVGNIPKSKTKEDIMEEFSKLSENLSDVIIYSSPDDVKKRNRGFAFLEYQTHKDASVAKRRFGNGRTRVWGCDIIVDWADPQEEPDEDTMSKVKVLYVRNLKSDVTEEQLKEKFDQYGKIERVKKIKDYGFVHFENRDDAVRAMEDLNGVALNELEMQISLAKPPSENRQKQKQKRQEQHRMAMVGQRGWGFDEFYGMPPPVPMRGGRGGYRPPMRGGDYFDDMYDYGGGWGYGDDYGGNYYDYYDDFSYGGGYGAGAARRGRAGVPRPPVARGRGIGMRGVGGGRGAMARGAPRGIRGGPRGAAAGRGGMRGGPGSRGAPRGMGPPNNGGMGKRKAQGDTNPGQSKKPRSQDNWGAQPIAQQPLNDQQWYQDSFDANTWG